MTSGRIITLTIFAALAGLFFVGVLRFRSQALLLYAAIFISFAINYRKMKGRDEKSVAFQKEAEARGKELPWASSNKDFTLVLMMGMCACLLLALLTILKS